MEITINDLLNLNHPNIIDIRSVEKYNGNHIPGSININSNLLLSNPDKYLNRNQTYYIYCQKGMTSRTIVRLLRVKGYNVFSVAGGYEAWLLK